MHIYIYICFVFIVFEMHMHNYIKFMHNYVESIIIQFLFYNYNKIPLQFVIIDLIIINSSNDPRKIGHALLL